MKHDTSKMQRILAPCEVRVVHGKERTLRFVISTERVARDGDIVRVKGWDFEDFKANPVVLAFHDHFVPAVGRVTSIAKKVKPKDGEPRIEADIEFAGLEQLHDLAETMYLLYRDGFMKAVSVGFLPLAFEEMTDEQKAELGMKPWGHVVSKATLWELSVVNVPSDQGALAIPSDEKGRAALHGHLLQIRNHVTGDDADALDHVIADLAEPNDPLLTEQDDDDIPAMPPPTASADAPALTRDDLDEVRDELSAQIDEMREAIDKLTARLAPAATPPPSSPPPSGANGEPRSGEEPDDDKEEIYAAGLNRALDRALVKRRGGKR